MKQLFSLKFKMHKLVNMIFYLIIFAIGFILGLTIDKASALEITPSWVRLSYLNGLNTFLSDKVCDSDSEFIDGWCSHSVNSNSGNHLFVSGSFDKSNSSVYSFNSISMYKFTMTFEGITEDTTIDKIRFSNSSGYTNYITPTYQSLEFKDGIGTFTFYVMFDSNVSYDGFYVFLDVGSNYIETFKMQRTFDVTELSLLTSSIEDLEYPTSTTIKDGKYITNTFNTIMKYLDFNYSLDDYKYAFTVHSATIERTTGYYMFFSTSPFTYSNNEIHSSAPYIYIYFNNSNKVLSVKYNIVESGFYYSTSSLTKQYTNQEELLENDWFDGLFDISVPNYHLNDGSIFEDSEHQDFQKVCWENFDKLTFSVTIDSSYDGSYDVYEEGQQDGETYVKSGFYVFDDITNLRRGTRKYVVGAFDYEYNASTWLSGLQFEQLFDIEDSFIFLKNENLIGVRYSDIVDALGNYDLSRGDSYYYDNLNKLLNSNYVPFTYYYNVVGGYYYDIFELNESKEKFCIYIPNSFIVTTLEVNELGGMIGDVPLHDDKNETFLDNTEFSKGLDTSQLFSLLRQFLSSIREVINYINEFVYAFFLSMPLTVQMFIYSCLTLCIVFIIIRMVIK